MKEECELFNCLFLQDEGEFIFPSQRGFFYFKKKQDIKVILDSSIEKNHEILIAYSNNKNADTPFYAIKARILKVDILPERKGLNVFFEALLTSLVEASEEKTKGKSKKYKILEELNIKPITKNKEEVYLLTLKNKLEILQENNNEFFPEYFKQIKDMNNLNELCDELAQFVIRFPQDYLRYITITDLEEKAKGILQELDKRLDFIFIKNDLERKIDSKIKVFDMSAKQWDEDIKKLKKMRDAIDKNALSDFYLSLIRLEDKTGISHKLSSAKNKAGREEEEDEILEFVPTPDDLDDDDVIDLWDDLAQSFEECMEKVVESENKDNSNQKQKPEAPNPNNFFNNYLNQKNGKTEFDKYVDFVNNLEASNEIKETIADEIIRLKHENPHTSDYNHCINWLEHVLALPWNAPYSPEYSLKVASNIIEKSHYGMKDVKDRIIEFLAVRKKTNSNNGAIICLVGPPGVGKTSIGKSIAEALQKKFTRFSLGSMKEEADLVGFRKTYVASCPGKLMQSLKVTKAKDPVIVLDELDKVSEKHPSPLPALLEILDPEQNKSFQDVYFDFPFDLSKVLFIITANDLSSIPSPILDRMEIIEVSGYTENEKIHIANDYLIPKLKKKMGLKNSEVKFTNDGIRFIVNGYTREAGVRDLERNLSKVIRKIILESMNESTELKDYKIDEKVVEKYLGIPFYDVTSIIKADKPGSALGLSKTSFGGDVLRVEIAKIPGKGNLSLTGKLGDVIKESAEVAFTWIKTYLDKDEEARKFFRTHDFHLHMPDGAVPKDGPSAGITFATAFYSLYTGKTVEEHLAMTGEVNLLGEVTAIGGLKEKFLGAKRNLVTDVLIPEQNMKDIKEMDMEVKSGLKIHPINNIEEGLNIAFNLIKTDKKNKSKDIEGAVQNASIDESIPKKKKAPCQQKRTLNC